MCVCNCFFGVGGLPFAAFDFLSDTSFESAKKLSFSTTRKRIKKDWYLNDGNGLEVGEGLI